MVSSDSRTLKSTFEMTEDERVASRLFWPQSLSYEQLMADLAYAQARPHLLRNLRIIEQEMLTRQRRKA